MKTFNEVYENDGNDVYTATPPADFGFLRDQVQITKTAYEKALNVSLATGLAPQALEAQQLYVDEKRIEYTSAQNAFNTAIKRLEDQQNALRENFKRDALEACGLTDHPLANKAFQFADSYSEGERTKTLSILKDLADKVLK